MKKIRLVVITLAAIFLAVNTLYALPEGGPRNHAAGAKENVFKELNLTPEQQQKLEENRKLQRQEMTELHSAMQEKQKQLQQELSSPGVNMETIDPLVNEIKTLQARLIDRRIKGIFTVKSILTPEQFAKFQQMTQQWQEKRKGRLEKRQEK